MSTSTKTDFSIDAKGYAAFDALSLKQLIIDRLNTNSNFTDQNFEGSNLSSIIDIIALSYHTLMFYLNQTSGETMFSDAQLYENMNRIVKALDYKPVGNQTCNLPFTANATSNLTPSTYTIPRYANVNVGGVMYSTTKDITFTKSESGTETLTELSNNNLLYQGIYQEYPLYTAIGENYEFVTILPGDDIIIDHFNIGVYVKDKTTGTWYEWKQTSSLFLVDGNSKAFEVRLNEHKRYELKFGNNITGKKLNEGDIAAIYYLQSDGIKGQVGINTLNGGTLSLRSTTQFIEIFNAIKESTIRYILSEELAYVLFSNVNPSTDFYTGETVEDIRNRAPKVFTSQYRLITKGDYEGYLSQQFTNIIKNFKVVNNWEYIDGHLRYLYEDLGLNKPNKDANILYNQVNFADACDFNNIYIYAVPQLEKTTSYIIRNNYLNVAQKNSIIQSLQEYKVITAEPVLIDPVYVAVGLGISIPSEDLTDTIKDKTKLVIIRDKNSQRSLDNIKNAVVSTLQNVLSGSELGGTINVNTLVNNILSIEGVKTIKTQRTDDSSYVVNGISLVVWNPIYPTKDIQTIAANLVLPYYKCNYLYNSFDIGSKIEVISEAVNTNSIEY